MRCVWVVFVLLALAPAAARAQAPATLTARAHFKHGLERYKAGEYDAAVVEIEAAIALAHEPDFDYLLGQAERQRGRCDRAIDAYRRFLKSGPPPSEVKVTEANILRCEEAIARAPAPPAPPLVPLASLPAKPPGGAPPGSSTGKIVGGVSAGLGVVALGVGAALGIVAGNQAAKVNAAALAHAMWTQTLQNDLDGAGHEGTAAAVLLGVGGALVAAGVVVVALSIPRAGATPNSKVSVRASADPVGGRVVAIFRF